jgi:hypothetical protein
MPDLGELMTVDDVASLLKVSRSWYTSTRVRAGSHIRIACLTSSLASTCDSIRTSFARFWIGKRLADVRAHRS